MEIKITKILNMSCYKHYPSNNMVCRFSGVHFKIDGENYFLYNAHNDDMDPIVILFKGRMKCHLEAIKYHYGLMREDTIIFKRKPGCLKYIDTEHFYQCIKERGLLKS